MTQEQRKILHQQFQSINRNGVEFAREFYDRLFAQYPQVRPMFKHSLSEQYTKFIGMLSIIIQGIDAPAALVPLIAEMGESHKGYGVLSHHYRIVEEIFLSVLNDTLPDDYSEESEQAWKQAFRFMSEIMEE